jgi:DNA-binding SARP family transcriptional activator
LNLPFRGARCAESHIADHRFKQRPENFNLLADLLPIAEHFCFKGLRVIIYRGPIWVRRGGGVPKKPQQLAKLSRPRLYDALARERLFRLLDEKRRHPVIWVAGPPGAGKTTLVGSYVQAHKRRSIWYQMDAGDRDVSTFFYFLTQACVSVGVPSRALPRMGPDNLADLNAFSRRFFRELFSRIPQGSLIVFDNFQEIVDSEPLLGMIEQAISEIPEGHSLVIISRTDPPARLVRQTAGQHIAIIGWTELRLDLEEARAILGGVRCDDETVARLHARSDGWAAGVVLMREQTQCGNSDDLVQLDNSRSAIFNYFATQLFEHLDADTQSVMLRTALLPYFSPQWARDLAGYTGAGDVIEQLYRRHFFIDRRDQGSYQYHALFREFLLARISEMLSREELCQLQGRAAALLEQAGDVDAGFALYITAGDWMAARRLAVGHAAELLKHGRWQTLSRWLDALRPEDFDADPWLIYWQGLAEMATDALQARETLERAYRKFATARNRTGELLSLAQILGSYFMVWDTVAAMDPWIAATEQSIHDDRPVTEESLARAYASLMVALLYRQPQNPLLHAGAQWAADRLDGEMDPTQKLRMAIFLAHYYDLMGEFSKAARAIRVADELSAGPDTDPLTKVIAGMRHAQHFVVIGDHERALSGANRAIASAREYEFPEGMIGFLIISRAHSLLGAGFVSEAAKDLEEARAMINPSHRMIAIYFFWAEFWCIVLLGDRTRARALWDEFAKVPPAGVPFNTAYNLPAIYFLAEEGRFGEALERVARWRTGLVGMGSPFINFNLDLMESFARLRSGDEHEAVHALRRAFACGAARGFENTLAWIPSMMSALCAFALRHDIEPDYVRQVVRSRRLSAPDPGLEFWPWPVRVYALGRFAVLKDGKPLVFSGRPQHRTLELLKAIIAFGGRAVSVARVTAALWPDAEGDAAQRAFAVALHRLRRLLESDRAVQLNDGLLSLDRQWCWVDALAFEDLADDAAEANKVDSGTAATSLLGLYRGHLFGDEESAWLLPHKERLRTKFQRSVLRLGELLEGRNDWEPAADLYRRGIEMDALSEDFYRRIMTCRSRQGRNAEAMETYRRCREMLSIVLGVAPSADTQALFRTIQAAGAAGAANSC